MKVSTKKGIVEKDDTLYGLLLPYKANNLYFRVLESLEEEKIVVQLSSNPSFWNKSDENEYIDYKILRRLDIDYIKLSVKFILPIHVIKIYGPSIGIKISVEDYEIIDELDKKFIGRYIIEFPIKYKHKVLLGVKKILKLSPQKKYEMLEKYMILKKEI